MTLIIDSEMPSNVGAGTAGPPAPFTFTFNNVAGTYLVVYFGLGTSSSDTVSLIGTPTYGGVPMTLIASKTVAAGGTAGGKILAYGLLSPPTGTNTFSIDYSVTPGAIAEAWGGAISFRGNNGFTPIVQSATNATAGSNSSTASGSLSGVVSGNIVLCGAGAGADMTAQTQTLSWAKNVDAGSSLGNGRMSRSTTAGGVTHSFTLSSSDSWATIILEVGASAIARADTPTGNAGSGNNGNFGTDNSITTTRTIAVGEKLLISYGGHTAFGAVASVTGLGGSNTATLVVAEDDGTHRTELWYCDVVTQINSGSTIHVNSTSANGGWSHAALVGYTGLAPGNAQVTATGTGFGTTQASGTTSATTTANSLVVALYCEQTAGTILSSVATGYTVGTAVGTADGFSINEAYKIVAATGTQSATATANSADSWADVIATFPVASGTTPVTKTLTPSYNVIARVAQTITPSYKLRVFVTKTVTPTYSVIQRILKSLSLSYAINAIPVNTVAPVITGTALPGQTLTTDNGTWTNTPTGYAYQWQVETSPGSGVYADIPGETNNTLVL